MQDISENIENEIYGIEVLQLPQVSIEEIPESHLAVHERFLVDGVQAIVAGGAAFNEGREVNELMVDQYVYAGVQIMCFNRITIATGDSDGYRIYLSHTLPTKDKFVKANRKILNKYGSEMQFTDYLFVNAVHYQDRNPSDYGSLASNLSLFLSAREDLNMRGNTKLVSIYPDSENLVPRVFAMYSNNYISFWVGEMKTFIHGISVQELLEL